MLPGVGEKLRAASMKHVPTAILSRQTAGIRGSSLIINLPGSPKSIRETIDEVFSAVPYCIDLIGGPYLETNDQVVKAYRPPNHRRHAKKRNSTSTRMSLEAPRSSSTSSYSER
jgi:molybdopterin adenylyltransferase